MSNPHLPVDILDQVIDHLCDAKPTLRDCCLVSKSWIPRTRRHLFADIKFQTRTDLKSWKETFPDPSTSPAYYAKSPSIGCPRFVTVVDAEPGGWIRGFSRVAHLVVSSQRLLPVPGGLAVSFVPLHGFSPVKSLHLDAFVIPIQQVFDLALSFPLLEDLTVRTCGAQINAGDDSDGLSTTVQLSSIPAFSGSLRLSMVKGIGPIARRLLSSPGDIGFRELALTWDKEEDIALTAALVERCSLTLESLEITCNPYVEAGPGSTSIDLSKATRLRAVAFCINAGNVEWVTRALQTIPPEYQVLRQISILAPYHLTSNGTNLEQIVGERIFRQWLVLDLLLVQLWEECSIRLKAMCLTPRMGRQDMGNYVGCLLPEITKRGIIDFVE